MKKILNLGLAIALSIAAIPVSAGVSVSAQPNPAKQTEKTERAMAKTLMVRLFQIKNLDKSHLSSGQKATLRMEVQGIHRSLKDLGGGVYISAGAVIVILIILIILL